MTAQAQKETLGFQTEVKQLLHLMIHALYSNKEIFLRELISNGSDAADKLRFSAIADPSLYENNSDLAIEVEFDEKARTITIRDNGIGMSREEVIANIGTIAKSGTKEFLQALSGDKAKDAQLIGQFGVGFYSGFIVADKITVITRRAGMTSEHGVRWESSGEGEYTIENINRALRGTEVILHLKKDEDEFLNDYRLRHIIRTYSDHIAIPVKMRKPAEVKDGEQKEETALGEFEVVNRATALWTLPKKDIQDSEYIDLYKHISHDFMEPLIWAHNRVEGKQEYISLLYIPSHAPFDLWDRDQSHGVKLYVKRVFIMDNAEQFLPRYLRFVKGIIDSSDLPLNISREILQNNRLVESIKSGSATRILGMLEDLAKNDADKYAKFWGEFGKLLKEGPGEDSANQEKIAKLFRFASTKLDTDAQSVSLEDYVARMKDGQDKIYYIVADSFLAAKNSPHLEVFRKKGIEVLLLSDRVDEWLTSNFTEFSGKTLQSVAKGDLDLGSLEDEQEKEEQKKVENTFESMVKQVEETLKDKIKSARISHRLTDSPACIVADQNDMSSHMQRLLQAAGQAMPMGKPIFELNPTHPLINQLKDEADDERFSEWVHILFDQSVLAEGGQLQDPATFVKRLNKMLLQTAVV